MLRNENGFTLIEVLVAATVLTIGLFGLLKLQIISIHQTQVAQNLTIANTQLQNMVELLRASVINNRASEITDWNALNERLLPQGHGVVEKNQTGYRVSVSWDERDPTRQQSEHIIISQNVVISNNFLNNMG